MSPQPASWLAIGLLLRVRLHGLAQTLSGSLELFTHRTFRFPHDVGNIGDG
jgi:hypothetical protein